MLNKETAKSLAIQYGMFCEVDLTKASHIDVFCRAQSLLEAQQNTGVELHDNEWLKELSDRHWAAHEAEEAEEANNTREQAQVYTTGSPQFSNCVGHKWYFVTRDANDRMWKVRDIGLWIDPRDIQQIK